MAKRNWKKACEETQEFLDSADADLWRMKAEKEYFESQLAKASGRCLDLELRLTAILAEVQKRSHYGKDHGRCMSCTIWRIAKTGKL